MSEERENKFNLEPMENPDPNLQEKVEGTYGLIHSIFKVTGFFSFILIETVTKYIDVLSKNDK